MYILLYGLDVLHVLLRRIRVVHAQVAQAAVFLRSAEVDDQRLAVADVQIAVRLGRETGVHLHALAAPAGSQILIYECLYKVFGYFFHVIPSQLILT